MANIILAIFAVLSLCGCAIVHMVGADGVSNTTFAFGIINIPVPKDVSSYSVSYSGLGLIKSDNEITFGYSKAQLIAVGGKCQIVFIIENKNDAQNAVELVKGIDNICIVGENVSNLNMEVER